MISGPIIPRTRESLWDLIHQDPSLIERGLQIVRGDIVLDEGLVIDALARDASGSPVLVFSMEGANSASLEERRIASRIREARDWFVHNWRVLATALPQCAVRLSDTPRLILVGFEFSEACLERLREPVFADLSVYRFEGIFIAGQRHIGVTPVFGVAIQEMESVDVPAGIRDADQRARSEQFLGIMKRLDPDLRFEGDRFSRRLFSAGGLLAELELRADSLVIAAAGDSQRSIQTEADVDEVADRVIRFYLEDRLTAGDVDLVFDEGRRSDQSSVEGGLAERALAERTIEATTTAPAQQDSVGHERAAGHEQAADEGRLTLGGLRERMAQAQVSDEEFDAFTELETRGDKG